MPSSVRHPISSEGTKFKIRPQPLTYRFGSLVKEVGGDDATRQRGRDEQEAMKYLDKAVVVASKL